jgi:hypothetical protein
MSNYLPSHDRIAAEDAGLKRQADRLDLSAFTDEEVLDIAAGNWPDRGEAFRLAGVREARGRGLMPMADTESSDTSAADQLIPRRQNWSRNWWIGD